MRDMRFLKSVWYVAEKTVVFLAFCGTVDSFFSPDAVGGSVDAAPQIRSILSFLINLVFNFAWKHLWFLLGVIVVAACGHHLITGPARSAQEAEIAAARIPSASRQKSVKSSKRSKGRRK